MGGAILGSHVAHAMFQKKIYYFDGKDRDSWGEFFSEALTTLGLLLTIFGGIKAKGDVPMLVGLFITAGYWFSSSTSFANPAVTIGRSFTDTFASITPKSWPAFMGGQAVGLVVGLPMCEWLVWGKPVKDALLVLVRSQPTKGGNISVDGTGVYKSIVPERRRGDVARRWRAGGSTDAILSPAGGRPRPGPAARAP